ncbi:hydrogenase [Desulfoprunum benzoelyticum]|uniref:Hydrogenase-4 component B n=1 Tax=Desulfoprunum benzoelyticum TaxID=1506996 RepID=A0A840URD4_9BACT|nr:proton-conducting transporter membrane subunit [Desulfoprunum benzoelyticum]MBB5347386.1 hydrogenase-4 component B [Desulfoprunum benzoelyticum]MBM9530936.1 hydrogenase [Desulfoprunum benzoelyticum]
MDTLFYALAVILAGGILPLLLYRQFKVMKAAAVIATVVGSMLGLMALTPALQDTGPPTTTWAWQQFLTLTFSIDSLSVFFLVPIFLICPLAALYGFHYMDKSEEAWRIAVNYCCLSLLIVSMVLVVCADSLITFALAWEVMSLTSYFLVVHEFHKKETRAAGYLYFVFAQAGAMCIFAAFGLIYSVTGSFSFDGLDQLSSPLKLAVFILTLLGFGSKAGIFPLHIWLPHAHPAAPSHISAVMSGVMIKMGIYGIFRFYTLLGDTSMLPGQIILAVGMASGVLGVVYALGKHDIKRLLAYHSVENIGIILIGAGLGMIGVATGNATMAIFGFAGSLLHVLNHSIFKSLLFMGAGAVLQKTRTRHVDELGGLIKRMPTTGRTFLVGSISISGLPPFNGFISEFLIYFAAFQGLTLPGISFLFASLAIISLAVIGGLAAACFTKVVGIVFLGEPRSEAAARASEVQASMTLPLLLLAVLCLVIGIFPAPFVELAFFGLRDMAMIGAIEPGTGQVLISNLAFAARLFLGILLGVTLLRRVLYAGKEIASGPTWGCGFTQPNVRMQYTGTSYAMSIVEFFQPFVSIRTVYSGIRRIFPGATTYETRVDDIAEIGMHRYLLQPLVKILDRLRWIQHGHIQLYIGYIVLTIVVLLLVF